MSGGAGTEDGLLALAATGTGARCDWREDGLLALAATGTGARCD